MQGPDFKACLAMLGSSLDSLHISDCYNLVASGSLSTLWVAPYLTRLTLDQITFKIYMEDFDAGITHLRCVTSAAPHQLQPS